LKKPKGQSEAVNRRRTDLYNTMDIRKEAQTGNQCQLVYIYVYHKTPRIIFTCTSLPCKRR